MQNTVFALSADRHRPTGRRPGRCRLALAVMLAALPLVAAGQSAHVLTPEEHARWTAIGRVNVGGLKQRGTCTGTLIAPDLVLTAAHCVPPRALRADAPERVHFIAGRYRDTFAADRMASAIHIHPDYRRGPETMRTLHADLALLVLNEAIPPQAALPVPIAALPGFTDALEIIAYSNRRPGALERTGPCSGYAADTDVLSMTCPAESGNSGAPVLWNGPDGPAIVAVTVARNTGPGRIQSFGARIPDILFEMAGRKVPASVP